MVQHAKGNTGLQSELLSQDLCGELTGVIPLAMETEKQMTAKAMVQKVQKMLRKRKE